MRPILLHQMVEYDPARRGDVEGIEAAMHSDGEGTATLQYVIGQPRPFGAKVNGHSVGSAIVAERCAGRRRQCYLLEAIRR